MRYILFLFIVSFCFLGCKNIDNNAPNQDISNVKDSNSESIESMKNFEGIWVRKDYIDSLKVNLSPLKSFDYLTDISSLLIGSKKSTDSTINIGLSYNNHEGGSSSILKKDNDFYINLHGELGYSSPKISLVNNTLSFAFENKKYIFEKVLGEFPYGSDAGIGIQYITNEILFKDKIFNNINIGENIIFKENRLVENFKDYTNYSIATDFTTDPDPQDGIVLKNDSKKIFFHFRFIDDNLLLYEYNDKQEDYKLKYTLSKAK